MNIPGLIEEDEEFTALEGAVVPRVDLVGKGANGIPRFLLAKQTGEPPGLFSPGFVRDLIKASDQEAAVPQATEGETALPNGIVLKGSPAAMAAFIHAASQRQREQPAPPPDEAVAKAKYSADDLRRMAASGEAMDDESYPIGDEDDLSKAVHAVGRGGADHDAIRRHVLKRAEALGKTSMIPDNWASDGSIKKTEVAKDMDPDLDSDPGTLDALDVTAPLAEPEDEFPGDPATPGSPAWEGIDAASAGKWLSVAARLRNALCVLADREMLEAAAGDDDDDAENAWSLQEAVCAVDYVIEQLAVFAAGEQIEAELGAELEVIGKALDRFDPAPLGVIEGLGAVRKAGRVLSAANETAIRNAVESLQKVLASLPEAPVAKEEEAPVAGNSTAAGVARKQQRSAEEQARDTGPVQAGGTTGMGQPRHTGPEESLPSGGPQQPLPGDTARQLVKTAGGAAVLRALVYGYGRQPLGLVDTRRILTVAKADGDSGAKPAMQAVFDENGDLVGIVDPADITPVAGAGGSSTDTSDDDGGETAGDGGDMTPQPAADAGTPAQDVTPDGTVEKTAQDPVAAALAAFAGVTQEAITKALQAQQSAHDKALADQQAAHAEELNVVKARLAVVEEQPAMPRVFANGQVPPASQLRGQAAQAPGQIDVTKAQARKQELYTAPDARTQDRIAKAMQGDAIAALAVIHGTPRQ